MAKINDTRPAGSISVRIAPLMVEVRSFNLEEDTTIGDALSAAGFNEDPEVRITTAGGENQTIADNDAALEDGDLITVISAGKVEAGK